MVESRLFRLLTLWSDESPHFKIKRKGYSSVALKSSHSAFIVVNTVGKYKVSLVVSSFLRLLCGWM